MRRTARAALAALAFLTLATPIAPPPPPGRGEPAVATLFAQAVPLNPREPDQRQLGPLRFLGGWVLTSDDRRFGAISALAGEPGGTLLALNDHAVLFRFAPPQDGGGAGSVAIRPLRQGPGNLARKVNRDSEALAVDNGQLWIGYENSNEVWRYAAGDLSAAAKAAPPSMRKWQLNRGAEAMLRFPDGRFLLVSEDEDDAGISAAVLFLGDPTISQTRALPLRIDPPAGQRVTDAASLPDGRLLFLTRGIGVWSGWTARLLIGSLPAAGSNAITTQEVASFESPLTRDNMEGLAVTIEAGRTIVWLASDDNLLSLQRSLLLKFEWVG
jgi:hypothetical protein